MTRLRFPVPYRPAGNNTKYRLGYARLELSDVPEKDAEVAVVLKSESSNFLDVDFRLHDGKLWERAVTRPDQKAFELFHDNNRASDLRSIPQLSGHVSRIPAMRGVRMGYGQHDWHELPADDQDMHPDFVASDVWKDITTSPGQAIFVNGRMYRESPGPVLRVPTDAHRYSHREWMPGAYALFGRLPEIFAMDRSDIADRIAIERFGALHPLRNHWGLPQFRTPVEKLPTWDSLSVAIEAVTAQTMASTNLFPRYAFSAEATRALVDLRRALQDRFDKPINTASRGHYALPAVASPPWDRPDAGPLLEPLRRFLAAAGPDIRKRAGSEMATLNFRLKHEAHLLYQDPIDDPELALL